MSGEGTTQDAAADSQPKAAEAGFVPVFDQAAVDDLMGFANAADRAKQHGGLCKVLLP